MATHTGITYNLEIDYMNKHLTYLLALPFLLTIACNSKVVPSETKNELPPIFPDYAGVSIPQSIAPLNFKATSDYTAIDAVIESSKTAPIHVQDSKTVRIPQTEWVKMLSDNKDDSLKVTVCLQIADRWVQYKPFYWHVKSAPIDYGLVYRLIVPGYEIWSKMGIYQRDLSTYEQTTLVENTLLTSGCVNCHSFKQTNSKEMNLHLRGPQGGTLLMSKHGTDLLETKTDSTIGNCVYPYWHPSGNYVAYSVNKTQQAFHEKGLKRVEVVDLESDVTVYNIRTNTLTSCKQLKSKDYFETFPAFSPDGRKLYFCTAAVKQLPNEYNQIRYNLCSIDFDEATGTFGTQVDTLVNAAAMGKSVSFPRPSYDGKYVMFTLSDYGNFSIWHKEADLWLLNLQTGEKRRLDEVNSDNVESYHSWSSNSRWFVFSSRRIDGLYTRPFIAYMDENGKATKPFLLPQDDPDMYDALLYSFNIPEFVNGKVEIDVPKLEKMIAAPRKKVVYGN